MSIRFIWLHDKDSYEEARSAYDHFNLEWDDTIQPIVFDTVNSCVVMDFGDDTTYYPTAGTAPEESYRIVIINALNGEDFAQ